MVYGRRRRWGRRRFARRRRYGKRRMFKRRRGGRKKFGTKPHYGWQGLARPSQMVKMRFADVQPKSAAAGPGQSSSIWIYTVNSTFDAATHAAEYQSMGAVTMAKLYERYCVVGARIKIDLTGGQYMNPIMIGWHITSELNGLWHQNGKDRIKAMGDPNGRFMVVHGGANGSEFWHRSITMNWSAKKQWGLSNIKDSMDKYGALWTYAPEEKAYFEVALWPMDLADTVGKFSYSITIDQIVFCSDRKAEYNEGVL